MMLQFIVGMIPATAFKTNVVVPFVYRTGLMSLKPRTTDVFEITEKGYVFMLKNMSSQIWDYVLAQIPSSEQAPTTDRVDILSFLFTLAYTSFGQGYPVTALTKAQKQLMFVLSEVGILYLRDKKAPYFFPTNEAINLVFGFTHAPRPSLTSGIDQAIMSHAPQQPLQIIVETNLQITAYVSTPLHVALLKIFVEVMVQLPNMVIGRLTRDKSKNAFRMGMKTSRIIDFLTTHAHPYVTQKRHQLMQESNQTASTASSTRNASVLPLNVIDQLQLWENELYRMDIVEAMVVDFREFRLLKYDRFMELISDLQSAKLLLWSSDKEALLSCRDCAEAEVMIRRFMRERLPQYTY